MSRLTGEFLQELFSIGFFNNNPFLTINEGVNLKDIMRYKLDTNIPETSVYVDAKSSYSDIKVGTTFEVMFVLHSPDKYENIESRMISSSIRPGVNLDYLPKGYSSICLIDFPLGIPKNLIMLKTGNHLDESPQFDKIYLTTGAFMREILKK